MHRTVLAALASFALVTGCAPFPPWELEPVSRSHPSRAASDALDACSITDTTGRFGAGGPIGIDVVESMGLVPHARDVPKYAPGFFGREPELQGDASIWVIKTDGEVILPLAPTMTDATCLLVGGKPVWFDTAPSEADHPAIFPLPTLAP